MYIYIYICISSEVLKGRPQAKRPTNKHKLTDANRPVVALLSRARPVCHAICMYAQVVKAFNTQKSDWELTRIPAPFGGM